MLRDNISNTYVFDSIQVDQWFLIFFGPALFHQDN